MGRSVVGSVLRAARPNFLSLTPICVLLGIGVASHSGGHPGIGESLLVLLAALLGHVSVNLLNEYHDFRSGLDCLTVRTPFSGGSGSLPAHPEAAVAAGASGLVALAAAVAIGLYFVYAKGWALLPLGLVGVALAASYTPLITRQPLLCLLAPGVAFGPVMVAGSAFALTGRYSWTATFASLPPLLLVSDLLLLNQFPDVEPDRQAGRRHLPIVWGRRRSAVLFGLMLSLAYVALGVGAAVGTLPPLALLGVLTLPVAAFLALRVRAVADDAARLIPYMGINVALIHVTLLLAAIGLFFG